MLVSHFSLHHTVFYIFVIPKQWYKLLFIFILCLRSRFETHCDHHCYRHKNFVSPISFFFAIFISLSYFSLLPVFCRIFEPLRVKEKKKRFLLEMFLSFSFPSTLFSIEPMIKYSNVYFALDLFLDGTVEATLSHNLHQNDERIKTHASLNFQLINTLNLFALAFALREYLILRCTMKARAPNRQKEFNRFQKIRTKVHKYRN